jgi:hypothetical protein
MCITIVRLSGRRIRHAPANPGPAQAERHIHHQRMIIAGIVVDDKVGLVPS